MIFLLFPARTPRRFPSITNRRDYLFTSFLRLKLLFYSSFGRCGILRFDAKEQTAGIHICQAGLSFSIVSFTAVVLDDDCEEKLESEVGNSQTSMNN